MIDHHSDSEMFLDLFNLAGAVIVGMVEAVQEKLEAAGQNLGTAQSTLDCGLGDGIIPLRALIPGKDHPTTGSDSWEIGERIIPLRALILGLRSKNCGGDSLLSPGLRPETALGAA